MASHIKGSKVPLDLNIIRESHGDKPDLFCDIARLQDTLIHLTLVE